MGLITLAGLQADFWRGRSVLITGHTGFKGGWLAAWLHLMGAHVTGFAQPPDTEPSFFVRCALDRRLTSMVGDLRDDAAVRAAVDRAQPEVIFHLGAQSLVRRSYADPVGTLAVNVMGTAHVLEAARATSRVRAIVIVTSDKCYENREWLWGYRENEPLGGRDPYSASKGCAELVTAAYRSSFFSNGSSSAAVASARAGNVIGGGDWAADRIVPDAMRALANGGVLTVRNPCAVRPWQHVLEPLAGYLMLAERLHSEGSRWAGAWNFGPAEQAAVPVSEVANLIIRCWGSGRWQHREELAAPHESRYLKLDSAKAQSLLSWRPSLTLAEAIAITVEWYRASLEADPDALFELTRRQIDDYARRKLEQAA